MGDSMVYPIQRQRGFQSHPANNTFSNQSVDSAPSRNNLQSKVQPLVSKGVGGISKTLNNVQQVLNVVQSTTPIVQQYGPMVKNIPAMYRMMKAFKEVESTDQDTTEVKGSNTPHVEKENQPIKPTNNSGKSKPKLFI